MGRPAKFTTEQLLDTSRDLVLVGGPGALTVAGVAAAADAPGASIYHRFSSRDALAGAMWLRAVERFQDGLRAALDVVDPIDAARAAAQHVVQWSRDNVDDAQVLLLYRSSDFVPGEWPDELVDRNRAQRRAGAAVVAELCRRLGATTVADKRRVVFAVVDIAYGAVRTPLSRGKKPGRELDGLVDDAVCAVLEKLEPPEKRKARR